MEPDKVSFGYREVRPEEKRRLVREQFDPIARRYDLADAVLSAGLDGRWRRKGLRLLDLAAGSSVLDLCGGTADFGLLAASKTGSAGRVVVYDFNRAMIDAGRVKAKKSRGARIITFLQGDAEEIAFRDSSFDAITLGFGLRNFVRAESGLKEAYRVLRPGGKILILEFSLPRRAWQRSLYDFYSFWVMPLVARAICGTASPFGYLAESIRVFPPPERVAEAIVAAGFSEVRFRRLSAGLATLYLAAKPGVNGGR